jgi:hypothetical protein
MLAPPPSQAALTVSVSPPKADTSVGVSMQIVGDVKASSITVFFPQALKLSNTGLKQCSSSDAQIIAGACADAVAGSGSMITGAGPFTVTPLVGAKDISFLVASGSRKVVLHGKLSQSPKPYTAKMRIALPSFLRSFNAFSLQFKAHSLFSTRGCGLGFKVTLGVKTKLTSRARCS